MIFCELTVFSLWLYYLIGKVLQFSFLELRHGVLCLVQVEYMILASHLMWAFWSVVRWVNSIASRIR